MAILRIKNKHDHWVDLVVDTLDSNSTSQALSAKQGKVLDGKVDGMCIKGSTTTINQNGTIDDVVCAGLTANHLVCEWGLSVGDTNDPPADIEILPATGKYDIIITNYGGTPFTVTPVFVLPQN